MSEPLCLADSEVLTDSKDSDKHQFWQEAIAMQQSSGLNIRQFCRNEGLKEAMFYAWRKKFCDMPDDKSAISYQNHQSQASSFIEVNMPNPPAEPLILEITGLGSLKIIPGFDISVLKQVLKVIKELDKC
jgi:hypothetical protein